MGNKDKTSEMLKAAGRSTPKELPQIMAKYRHSMGQDPASPGVGGEAAECKRPPRKIAFGEMVDRVAGFQHRYQSQLTGGNSQKSSFLLGLLISFDEFFDDSADF